MISISHHGATSGVTGSCHELTLGLGAQKSGILIDCGLFQGQDEGRGASASDLSIDFPIEHIRALVVTHVHIDHVGRIPYLLAAGFDGPIICSEPSAIMLPEILEDALKIGFTRDRQLIERVLGLIRSRLVPVPYGQWHSVFAEGYCSLSVRLQRAGHILGSAYVECDVREGDVEERIVFSGDLGAPHAPLLPAPQSPERADRLVIESTYGDKDHEDRETRRYRLKALLEHALEDGGTVLVPAFSIGRTQELLYEMESLIHEFGDRALGGVSDYAPLGGANPTKKLTWNDLEIVVDSPLAAEFTRIYRDLKPYWDAEATDLVRQGRHPLSFEQLTVINSHEDHLNAVDYLARSHRPCVVLAGSGMCAGGRVVNYLKAMLGDKRNDVLFVGYQAAGTPGRDILTYGPRGGWVELDGDRYDIRARIHLVGGYSAHAGQSDLLRFVEGIPGAPTEIRVVHGDEDAKAAFQVRLQRVLPGSQVLIPA
ncbi:MBL fold metallo-hydrolase [Marinobacter sp.]|jgi:metallo-beta-lactamase family protein|uniref:MBL fold metallo-hydrolase RNA specificity domain-containing protein n=1 Tax=Marinobacter sp. TaxID=50741 RepID=UPI000C991185|nr:MBL fold metallo-hydrolase [Marinobacter sp.]MAK51983.1 MBL fold hydrolase [Marinobacter sp.]|tara:strand:- start:1504 stop:2952 length:1449 start_codon:yes stop_codon:yes gene_type:complete